MSLSNAFLLVHLMPDINVKFRHQKDMYFTRNEIYYEEKINGMEEKRKKRIF